MNENMNNNVEQNNQQPVQNTEVFGQEQMQNTQMLNQQPMMQDVNMQSAFGTPNMETPKFDKKKMCILGVIVALVIALVGYASYYFISNNNPTSVYRNIVKKTISEMFAVTDKTADKVNASLNLDMDLDLEEGLLDEEILDLINKTTLGLNVQMDKEAEQLVLKVDSEHDKESLLDLQLYIDSKKEKTYLYAKDYYDKYLEVPVDDYSEISELFNSEDLAFGQMVNKNKAEKILTKEFLAIITSEDCYKEDGYFVFKITEKELTERLVEALENLKDNKEFLDCFEDADTIEDAFESIIDSYDPEYLTDEEMVISIKKTAITNKVEEIIVEYVDVKLEFTVDGDEIEYKATSEGEKVLEGTIKITEEKDTVKTELTFKVPEVGTIGINLETTYIEGKNIDKAKSSDAKNIEDLSEDEQAEIMTKIQESKLYELIAPLMESGYDDEYYDDDYYTDDDYYSDYDTEINTNVNSGTGNTIKLYDSGNTVSYNVPSGYTLSYDTEDFKTYTKGDIDVTIYSSYDENEDEYLNELDDTKDYFAKNYPNDYQNMVLSSKMSKIVNGRTFYYRTFNFDYVAFGTTKYYEQYYTTKISGYDYLIVEVEAMDTQISDSDLETFLTIN